MDINELLDIIEYGLKYYSNEQTGKRINLLEYYAFTDISPLELSKIANRYNHRGFAAILRDYDEKNFWLLKPVDLGARLNLFHCIKGHELTPEDKMTISDKMVSEGFPLIDGVYDLAARCFVEGGVDAISKEQIRNKFMESYNFANHTSFENVQFASKEAVVLSK